MTVITNEISIVCNTCGCSMSYSIADKHINNGGIQQTFKVYPCDRCVRDIFDEAFKIMSDKVAKEEIAVSEDDMIHYTNDDPNEFTG